MEKNNNSIDDKAPVLSGVFAFLLVSVTAYFVMWGMDYTNGNHTFIFILATIFGVFMAFNIGGNDVANSFGTSVGAGTLTIKQALIVAAVFEISGAVIAGGEVTKTIRKGIVDLSVVNIEPMQFVYIMMSALLAAALWLLFASRRGWPVSTTHSIIGGIVGSAMTLGFIFHPDAAWSMVKWDKIGLIAVSWVLSPALGGLVAYLLYGAIKKHVLRYNDQAETRLKEIKQAKSEHKKEYKNAFERLSDIQKMSYTNAMARDAHVLNQKDFEPEEIESDYYRKMYEIETSQEDVHATRALETWVPMIAAIGAMIIVGMLLLKGLKHMHLGLTTLDNVLIVGMLGAVVWMATFIFAKTLKGESLQRSTFLMFSWMQVFTASGFAFSHGSNDIANAIGPFAAVLDVLRTGAVGSSSPVPTIVMATFGVSLIVGLWFIGKEVIKTVGTNLTEMHPASGFAAELSAASVVMLASFLGLPVSSTHILIGAVLGIGIVNSQTNWGLMKPIAMAWVITLPAAGILASLTFLAMNAWM